MKKSFYPFLCVGGGRHRLCHVCLGPAVAVVPMERANPAHPLRAVCEYCDVTVYFRVLQKDNSLKYSDNYF